MGFSEIEKWYDGYCLGDLHIYNPKFVVDELMWKNFRVTGQELRPMKLLAYYSAKAYYMNPFMELPSGKDFADVVYLPKRGSSVPAMIVELKWDYSAEGAIAQIKDKGYAEWTKGYTGDILLVGLNYDKETKEHQCKIEKL